MLRSAPRLAVAVAALGIAAMALPASAAAPSYSPGDVVTVDGASVTAPAPGHTVAISVDRLASPSTTLTVSTDAAGKVVVSRGADAHATHDVDAAAPNKCDDPAYSLLNGASWRSTYNWRYKANSTPSGLTRTQATNALKTSVNNITTARNGCGLADEVSATNTYRGTTSASSDVTSGLQCVSNPNGLNVTEFGPINGSGVLAATCTYSTSNGEIVYASVRINTAFRWWVSGACSNAYGLKAVMTHEYGHAYGLGHVDEGDHGQLTMSTNINGTCSNFEASLGRGDVLALRDLY